jgi:hypothetical protein
VLGSVTRANAPCPDFVLTLQWFDGMATNGTPAAQHEVRSDASGQFVWRGPVRTTTGTLLAVRAGSALDAKVLCTPEPVHAGQTSAKLPVTVLALDRTLFGRVHDVRGAPIAGAELTVNGWHDVTTFSDADGRYELKVPGPLYPLLVQKTGYRERFLDAYVVEGTPRNELDIELLPGASFRGRVVDEAGNPIAGAKVHASGLTRGTETDAAGQFVFGGAAPDESHGLTVTKAGFQPTTTVASAGRGKPVEIVLRPGLVLTVRVVGDPRRSRRRGARRRQSESFRPMENRGYSDAQGRLRVADLPAKTIDVLADKAGFVSARTEVDVPNQTRRLVLVLRSGRTIAGRVLDARRASRSSAPRSTARPRRRTAKPRTVGSRATSDGEGRFTIRELPPEPCAVMAHHTRLPPRLAAGRGRIPDRPARAHGAGGERGRPRRRRHHGCAGRRVHHRARRPTTKCTRCSTSIRCASPNADGSFRHQALAAATGCAPVRRGVRRPATRRSASPARDRSMPHATRT